ncbi:MAG: bifunctional phosphopantothenoylcysteine decarboxylase/phosphopantothenate--cysteine ligase CoaBC [Bacteroidota bacterium]|jgi:phosphopantothenoylcysteine decarboxylase/phosphopantothenate--cysteine ligase
MMLSGKKIILAISGSIAAYKSILLLRLLIKQGAEVKVIMTPASKSFVSPLVLSTLSGHPVVTELSENDQWENHVALGRWADLMIVAPLSCNTMAKMAQGLCDNLFLAVYLSATCPVMIAPAMDEDMWKHPATKSNLQLLRDRGHQLIPVGNGELASGLIGEGRMAEPEDILTQVQLFFSKSHELKGKKILITAGPTYESIDPVRFIGNHSTGKMGYAIAAAFVQRGGEVTLISGPVHEHTPGGLTKMISVQTAEEMYEAAKLNAADADIIIMAAAVADYTPVSVSETKIKKHTDALVLELKKTTDILKHLGEIKQAHQLLIGFALETEGGDVYALKKLKDKNADAIVLNIQKNGESGFGSDTNQITIFEKNGKKHCFEVKTKRQVAEDIVNTIKNMLHA